MPPVSTRTISRYCLFCSKLMDIMSCTTILMLLCLLFSNCGLLSPSVSSYFYAITYNTFSGHRQEAVEGASIIAKIPNFVKRILGPILNVC